MFGVGPARFSELLLGYEAPSVGGSKLEATSCLAVLMQAVANEWDTLLQSTQNRQKRNLMLQTRYLLDAKHDAHVQRLGSAYGFGEYSDSPELFGQCGLPYWLHRLSGLREQYGKFQRDSSVFSTWSEEQRTRWTQTRQRLETALCASAQVVPGCANLGRVLHFGGCM